MEGMEGLVLEAEVLLVLREALPIQVVMEVKAASVVAVGDLAVTTDPEELELAVKAASVVAVAAQAKVLLLSLLLPQKEETVVLAAAVAVQEQMEI